MKYCVTVVRTGCLFIEAESECEAVDIANHQLTDAVCWSDSWEASDCMKDDSEPDDVYIRRKAYD